MFPDKTAMSKTTQIEFERLIIVYFQQYKCVLELTDPTFCEDGYITTATMTGSGGYVEIRCGPAEYHAELFVHTLKDQKRWNLVDLMSVASVRLWMLQNRPHTSGRSLLEAEIDYAFCLLVDGLKGVSNFGWLNNKN